MSDAMFVGIKLDEFVRFGEKTEANYLSIISLICDHCHSPVSIIKQYVPDRLFTNPLFFKKAFKITPFAIGLIKDQPLELVTQALKRNLNTFEFVNPELKTYELCLSVTDKNPFMVLFVPSVHKTYELLSKALEKQISVFGHLTAEDQLPEFIEKALAHNIWYLSSVRKQTPAMCLKAMQIEPKVFKDVKICHNPNVRETIENLNKLLIKTTIENICLA